MTRTIAVLGASNTGKSTLVDRMCALEGQPLPAAAPASSASRASPISARPGRRSTPRARSSSCTSRRRAPRRRRRGDLRRPRSGGARPRLALPARRRGGRHAGAHLHQPHRRGDRPRPRHRRRAAGLRPPPDHPAPDPDPRGRQITGAVDLVSERAWAYHEGAPSTARRDPRGHARARARGPRRAAGGSLRVRRPPARGADRGPRAAERRGLRHLRPRPAARTG